MNVLQFIIDIRSKDNGVMGQMTKLQTRLDDADRSANRLANTVGVKLKSAFMSLPGAQFFTNPIVALTTGVGVVAKMGMEAEKTATSFKVLAGSEENAAKLSEQMKRYNALYGTENINDVASQMLSYSVSQDKMIKGMEALANIAQGDTERLKGLSLVLSQVSSNTRLSGEDFNQFVDRGFNPLIQISKQTGKSMLELRDEMSKGAISFDMVLDSLINATTGTGMYAGMLDKILSTPYGAYKLTISMLRDTMLELYNVISPLLIPAFTAFSSVIGLLVPPIRLLAKFVDWLVSLYKDWNPLIIAVTAAVAAYTVTAGINTLVLKGWTIAEWAQVTAMIAAEKAQKLLNLAMSMNPIGLIIAAIAALVAIVITCWQKFAGFRAAVLTAWDTVKGFAVMIKDHVIARFKELIGGIGSIGKALLNLIKGDFNAAWEEAQKGAKKLAGIETKKQLWQNSKALAGQTSEFWQQNYQREQAKQKAKEAALDEPTAAAGTVLGEQQNQGGSGSGTGNEGKANNITAGGTRNTQITINISKFFDYLNVTMMDKADGREIEKIVIESMNRALETASSAAR